MPEKQATFKFGALSVKRQVRERRRRDEDFEAMAREIFGMVAEQEYQVVKRFAQPLERWTSGVRPLRDSGA